MLCGDVSKFPFLFFQQPKNLAGFSDVIRTLLSMGRVGMPHFHGEPGEAMLARVCTVAPAGFADGSCFRIIWCLSILQIS